MADLPRPPRPARPPSVLPDSDREWLAQLIRTEVGRVDRKIDGLTAKVDEIDRRQLSDARHSATADLEQQRQLSELWQRVGAKAGAEAGATAGHEAATVTAKKWGAVTAGISLLTILVHAALGQVREPPPPPPSPPPQVHTGRP